MDKEKALGTYLDSTSKIFDTLHKMLCKKYDLTDDQGYKISYLLTQLKQLYTLTIYDEKPSLSMQSTVCLISIVEKDSYTTLDDLEFVLSIEHISGMKFSTDNTKVITLKEFIDIFFEYEKTRDMSLHIDLKWR